MSLTEQQGASVLCTIHQPSSEIFALFDAVILLKDGRVLYQGPSASVVRDFASCGFPMADYFNPADFIMTVATKHDNGALAKAGLFAPQSSSLKSASFSVQISGGSSTAAAVQRAPFWKQLMFLLARDLRINSRDFGALVGRFGVGIFLFALCSCIFENSASRDDADSENLGSHFGVLFFAYVGNLFSTAAPILLTFPSERPVFLREYSTGTYGALPYFLSKACFELPLAYIQALMSWGLAYPISGFQGSFIRLVSIGWGLGIATSSVALLLGCAVPDVKTAQEVFPIVFIPQFLFSGIFVRLSQVPSYLRWAQYLCSLKYAINLASLEEFRDCGANSSNPLVANAACKMLLDDNGIKRENIPRDIFIMIALVIGFRILAAIVIKRKADAPVF